MGMLEDLRIDTNFDSIDGTEYILQFPTIDLNALEHIFEWCEVNEEVTPMDQDVYLSELYEEDWEQTMQNVTDSENEILADTFSFPDDNETGMFSYCKFV